MCDSSYACFAARVADRIRTRNVYVRYALAECLGTFLLVSACRVHHSVETPLLNIHNDLLPAMNCGKITRVIRSIRSF
ncbi:hypothetical protein NP493_326g00023 [Ridgeia piscesae]|uniref:Uncharacterized protein n=1 Tax=Ridgeia piscesae TaxID=27915 RepID=A0AAD9NVU6_RIDPI|nr:hypothetical protein NP493_326g00023 [Ridgeia piscesae]